MKYSQKINLLGNNSGYNSSLEQRPFNNYVRDMYSKHIRPVMNATAKPVLGFILFGAVILGMPNSVGTQTIKHNIPTKAYTPVEVEKIISFYRQNHIPEQSTPIEYRELSPIEKIALRGY